MPHFGFLALVLVSFYKCVLVPARSVSQDAGCPCAEGPPFGNIPGPLEITLDVFSGAKNPTWTVYPSDNLHRTLFLLLQQYESTPLPSILGYRGFKVHGRASRGSGLSQTIAAGSSQDLETILLYTGLRLIEPTTVEIIQELLCKETSADTFCNAIPTTTSSTSPTTTGTTSSTTTASSHMTTGPSTSMTTDIYLQTTTGPSTPTTTGPFAHTTTSPSSSTTIASSSYTTSGSSLPTTTSFTSHTATGHSSPTISSTSSSSTGPLATTTRLSDTTTTGPSTTTIDPSLSTTTEFSSSAISSESSTSTSSSSLPTGPSATSTHSSSTQTISSSTTPTNSPQTTSPVTTSTPTTTPRPCKCPRYKPGKWNNNPNDKANNNCYNYATDSKTGTYAQPGLGSGKKYTSLTGPAIKAAAIRDGLKVVKSLTAATKGECLVALMVWPGKDFHWYRRDAIGLWSHKPGSRAATDIDNSGYLIMNPRRADTGPYKFVTFMSYCPGKINVKK